MTSLLDGYVRTPVTTTTVASGGATLATYDGGVAGTGIPLVFLHAAVADARMWARQFDTFAATRRTVAYDRRGFGATPAVDEPFSSVADLFAVLDALSIDRAILVGCSQGGRIALDATLARPGRVAALALVGAAIGGAPERVHDARLDPSIVAYEAAKADHDIDTMNRIEARIWLDGPFVPEGRVAGAARDLFLAMNRIALDAPSACDAVVPEEAWTRLPTVAVPTLVLWGTLDVPSVITNMQHAAATIPGARACALDGIAHLPSVEAPERFDPALAAFLHDVDPA